MKITSTQPPGPHGCLSTLALAAAIIIGIASLAFVAALKV